MAEVSEKGRPWAARKAVMRPPGLLSGSGGVIPGDPAWQPLSPAELRAAERVRCVPRAPGGGRSSALCFHFSGEQECNRQPRSGLGHLQGARHNRLQVPRGSQTEGGPSSPVLSARAWPQRSVAREPLRSRDCGWDTGPCASGRFSAPCTQVPARVGWVCCTVLRVGRGKGNLKANRLLFSALGLPKCALGPPWRNLRYAPAGASPDLATGAPELRGSAAAAGLPGATEKRQWRLEGRPDGAHRGARP